jgi:hypothetical protein
MAGGRSGYLNFLRKLCQHVVVAQNSSPQTLTAWIQDNSNYGYKQAKKIESLLRGIGVITQRDGGLSLSEVAKRWFETEEDSILVAQLHGQIQFFGEMLAELNTTARSIEELHSVAMGYGMTWTSRAQVDRRRGWLQSAGMIKPSNGGRLTITNAGRQLLSQLQIHQPLVEPLSTQTLSAVKAVDLCGIDYVSPTRNESIESKRVFEVDPDLVDRGTTAHMDVQDQFAAAVESAGLKPLSPAAHDPQFDVAWRMGNSVFVVEVKSVTEENENRQLRLGLG